jgi:hypothetical protein
MYFILFLANPFLARSFITEMLSSIVILGFAAIISILICPPLFSHFLKIF